MSFEYAYALQCNAFLYLHRHPYFIADRRNVEWRRRRACWSEILEWLPYRRTPKSNRTEEQKQKQVGLGWLHLTILTSRLWNANLVFPFQMALYEKQLAGLAAGRHEGHAGLDERRDQKSERRQHRGGWGEIAHIFHCFLTMKIMCDCWQKNVWLIESVGGLVRSICSILHCRDHYSHCSAFKSPVPTRTPELPALVAHGPTPCTTGP